MKAIVITHNGAKEATERHAVNWKRAFDGLFFISPSDDWLPGSLAFGLSCRNGRGAIERMIFAATLASRFPVACVMEYDTYFPASKIQDDFLPQDSLACSAIFENYQPEFSAPIYGHSPWIARGEDWWKIVTHAGDSQGGWPDRWLADAAERAGVRLLGLENGFSCDGIWNADTIAEAARPNRPVIHGLKTEQAFSAVA